MQWRHRLRRGFHLARLGLALALFSGASLLLAATVIPILRLIPGPRDRKQLRVQGLIARFFRLFLWGSGRLGLVRIVARGDERLRTPEAHLVVANHPTLFDVLAIVARMPQADCVVKRELWSSFFLGGVVRGAGYIPNDGGEALVKTCSERLRAGRSVVLFPEGTRSPAEGLGPFQRGVAHIALESGCPLLPVVLACDPPALLKGQRWYHVPPRRLEFTLFAGLPLRPDDLLDPGSLPATNGGSSGGAAGPPRAVVARRLTQALRAYFEQRLKS